MYSRLAGAFCGTLNSIGLRLLRRGAPRNDITERCMSLRAQRGNLVTPRFRTCVILGVLLACAGQSSAQVVLQTQDLRLEVSADGLVKSLTAKSTGTEYAWTAAPMPMASVYRGGQMAVGSQEAYGEFEVPQYRGGQCLPASAVSLAGDKLTIRFAGANVTATYQVTTEPHYLAFKLLSLAGDSIIDRIDLLQLRVKRLPFLGPWIDVAYDDQFGICLCAGNIRTNAGMSPSAEYVEMRAIATRDVALEGATAVLFGCPNPKERVPRRHGDRRTRFPHARRREEPPLAGAGLLLPLVQPDARQRGSVHRRGQAGGISHDPLLVHRLHPGRRALPFNKQFPNGIDDLKKVTDRIRGAGLAVGIHIHYSKADRTDSYVTPVPDDRLHKVRTFLLAAAVDEKADTLTVYENPAGCTRDKDRRILKIGQELIAYRDYTTEPPYQFTGCERGPPQDHGRRSCGRRTRRTAGRGRLGQVHPLRSEHGHPGRGGPAARRDRQRHRPLRHAVLRRGRGRPRSVLVPRGQRPVPRLPAAQARSRPSARRR